jgi:hypothetical protein
MQTGNDGQGFCHPAHNIKSESFTKTSILIYVADKPLLPESSVNTELKLIIAPSQMLPPRSPSSCTCISSGIGPVFGITTKHIKSQVRSDLNLVISTGQSDRVPVFLRLSTNTRGIQGQPMKFSQPNLAFDWTRLLISCDSNSNQP